MEEARTRLEKAEAERLLKMEDELGQVVINQDDAIKAIARSVRRSSAWLLAFKIATTP